jgi:chromosome segregation ATPase
VNQKEIDEALAWADAGRQNRETDSQYADTLATAYRELQGQYEVVDAALTAVCEERDKYHDDLEKAQTKAGRYLTKLIGCNNALMDKAQRGDALADELLEIASEYAAPTPMWKQVWSALDRYRGNK